MRSNPDDTSDLRPLSELGLTARGGADPLISGLSVDSRGVSEGTLFAALPGSRADGREFIGEAIARGAVAVLAGDDTSPTAVPASVPLVTTPNPRQSYAWAASRFFGNQPTTIAAITGTNGKTSVAEFLRQIWSRAGHLAASAGTLGVRIDAHGSELHQQPAPAANLTTPDSVDLHRMLAELTGDGVQHLAIEASSHGLDQYRLDGLRISAAAFTNLTRDHLDYHGSMEVYLTAKMRLFSDLLKADGVAVVNVDDPAGAAVRAACQVRRIRVLEYGRTANDLRLCSINPWRQGQRLELDLFGDRVQIELPLSGPFQAMNAICALGLAIALGESASQASAALGHLVGAPGRVQLVGTRHNGAAVYVDYAHTPDALATVLQALRPHTEGNLHVVFGCGGDRDPGKRIEMGKAAARLADQVVVTDDNPRSEDPRAIRRQAMKGCPGATEIGNRAEAIAYAIDQLGSGDLLVVAGKGHERGQITAGRVLPFDDVVVVQGLLGKLA